MAKRAGFLGEEALRHRMRAVAWGLLAFAVATGAVIVVVGAFSAPTPDAFNRWGVWATVDAVPFAAVAVLLALWDKMRPGADAAAGTGQLADELAAAVLREAQTARSRLVGPGEPGDDTANVRYTKSSGRFREVGGMLASDLNGILAYYESLSPRRLVVLGGPGAGKTVLALELQVRLLEARREDPAGRARDPVPVLISASAYDHGRAWEDWFARHLALRFDISRRTAERLIRDGRIVPLVDGLDEMDPTGASGLAQAEVLVRALNEMMDGRERAPVVVTSRPSEYEALTCEIDKATHVEVTGLTSAEAAAYLDGQIRDSGEQRRWDPVLTHLGAHPDGQLARQLATPWRLTLALAAFRDTGDPASLLPPPGISDEDYSTRMASLLLGGYVPAAVRRHGASTRYSEPQVQHWLTVLANGLTWPSPISPFLMLKASYYWSANDIILHKWWWSTGRRITPITHFIIIMLPSVFLFIVSIETGDVGFGYIGYTCVITALIAIEQHVTGFSSPPVRLMSARSALRVLALWLTVGLALGLWLWLGRGVVIGLGLGLMLGLALAPVSMFTGSSPETQGPRKNIRNDGIVGLTFGLWSGTLVGIGFRAVAGHTPGLTGKLIYVPAAILTYGLTCALTFAWTRYHVMVLVNAVRGRGPLRFGKFLDWGVEAGLLRVSGIAYQFRHRQLQDWLASHHR